MAGKKEFSAVVVKVFKSFFQLFPVPDGESEDRPSQRLLCVLLGKAWVLWVTAVRSCRCLPAGSGADCGGLQGILASQKQ